MNKIYYWSNKKKFIIFYMIGYILSISYFFMVSLELIEGLFISLLPALLFGYWSLYAINVEISVGLPNRLKLKGYEEYFGTPSILVNEKERKVVVIGLTGKMKVNLSVKQFGFSDLLSIKYRGSTPRGFEKALSTNLPRSFLDMKFRGQQRMISVGFRDTDAAKTVFEILKPKTSEMNS